VPGSDGRPYAPAYTRRMAKLRVHGFGVSVDGYGAGPRQALGDPMGVGGMVLHNWVFPTRAFRRMHAGMMGENGANADGGTTGIDDAFAARGFEGIGAWILGRNMFGPVRGPWTGDALAWRGWWGENPVYHVPVFVLTHHPREPLVMQGGTTFHFVTGGVREACTRAIQAAGSRDVRVGGGVSTVRQFLVQRLIDEMHLAVAPAALGGGENLFEGLDLPGLGYTVRDWQMGEAAAHVVFRRDS